MLMFPPKMALELARSYLLTPHQKCTNPKTKQKKNKAKQTKYYQVINPALFVFFFGYRTMRWTTKTQQNYCNRTQTQYIYIYKYI